MTTTTIKTCVLPEPDTLPRSCILMKKLTGICVSTIAYLRNLFDEKDFAVRSFKGIPVRIVKGQSSGVQCLSNWLTGAFEAIDKNYLKTLIFEITHDGALLETYTFFYSYKSGLSLSLVNDGGDKANVLDPKVAGATSEDICSLLRNILVALSNKPRLPSNCITTVRIDYHDGTPESYEPPGFKPFTGDVAAFKNAHETSRWTVGKISTSFHTMKLTTRQIHQIQSSSAEIGGVVCPCGLKDNSGILLKCENCGTLQHLACFKIFSEGDSQSQRTHTCKECSGSQTSKDFDSSECLFRRVLSLCVKDKSQTISIRKIINHLHLDVDTALLNMRRLQREGALQKSVQPISNDKSDFMYKIDKISLMRNLKPKYFN